jgi:AcrR family transcriptional regulator
MEAHPQTSGENSPGSWANIIDDPWVIILDYRVISQRSCHWITLVVLPWVWGLMKTKQQVVSEFRRTEIMNAARSIFARKGFARGIINEIAQEAGLAKGTVYLYFASKKDLYRAVLDYDMEFLTRATLERIDAATDLEEKIKAFVLVRLENADANREFFKIMDTEPGGISFTRSQYRNWLREPVLHLTSAIETASRQGQIRPVPAERTAWAIADMTRGAIQRRLLGAANSPPGEDAEFLVEFAWAALKK